MKPQSHEAVVESVRQMIIKEVAAMARTLNLPLNGFPFNEISADAEASLDRIACHLNGGETVSAGVRVSQDASRIYAQDRVARIGCYPVSADPFHWGHLLIGLSAMARFKLDKVIYVLSGSDERKPGMTHPGTRHPIGRTILNMFKPLFDYSPGGDAGDADGESGLFHLLALNPDRKIDAFYIAGSDHCRRADPATGNPDTVQKLEENMTNGIYNFNGKIHRVFPIFVRRGLAECSVKTPLHVSCMPGLPFDVSSTAIRRAFAGREDRDKLAFLPYTGYLYIRALGLYSPGRQVGNEERSPSIRQVA
jgi:hypothetical protein